jgi:type VI secretion system protein ImpL
LNGNVASAVAASFSAGTGPGALCRQVTVGRYPFDRASAQDAPLDDFARLFAPNGLLDSFFQTQIRPYVDTSGAVWRSKSAGGIASPVDAATIAAFQRAAAIRDAFFATGGSEPQLRFTITPVATASSAARLVLGNMVLSDTGQDPPPVPIAWPEGDRVVRAAISFGDANAAPVLRTQGSWALLRLIDQARITPSGTPEDFTLTWRSGTHLARFALQAASSRNPFGRNLLAGFRCPTIR